MSKQLTPIGKAIEWAKRAQKVSKEKGIGNAAIFTSTILYLESLLPEEKQFAEGGFSRGTVCGDNPEYTHHDSFLSYYKKYEDENKDKA